MQFEIFNVSVLIYRDKNQKLFDVIYKLLRFNFLFGKMSIDI